MEWYKVLRGHAIVLEFYVNLNHRVKCEDKTLTCSGIQGLREASSQAPFRRKL